MAKAYHKTPYELVTDSFVAYNFNRAIYHYGTRVDNLLSEREEVETFGKKELRPKYNLEEALKMASEDPKKPKLKGLAAVFESLRVK